MLRNMKMVVTMIALGALIIVVQLGFIKHYVSGMPNIISVHLKRELNSLNISLSSKTLPSMMTGILDDNATRKKRLKDFCTTKYKRRIRKGAGNEYNYYDVLADENHKAIYCPIPKVASSTLIKTLADIDGTRTEGLRFHAKDIMARFDLHALANYSKEERVDRVKKYFKYIFVRHPLVRIVSAYRDKIESHTRLEKKIRSSIKKHFPEEASVGKNSNVTFSQFILYVVKIDTEKPNEHWKSYGRLCKLCEISYDFIGRQENFKEEVNILFKNLNIITNLPKNGNSKNTDLKTSQDYYKQLSKEAKQAVVKHFRDDMDMFGYTENDILQI